MAETLVLGRAKRATAGNRMQALLDAAHKDEDELAEEVVDDVDFQAPKDVADVFMEDFADTDDELDDDEREEREAARAAKAERTGTKKKTHNPLAHKPVRVMGAPKDATEMDGAPTAIMNARRRARREELRQLRDQSRRAGMRASTLKTDIEVNERELADRERLAKLPKTVRTKEVKMTQDQMIAAALETEELNKEALKDWLAREEERRELRKVVRKRVRGPRMSWVSRTVGNDSKVVVIDDEDAGAGAGPSQPSTSAAVAPSSSRPQGTTPQPSSSAVQPNTSNPPPSIINGSQSLMTGTQSQDGTQPQAGPSQPSATSQPSAPAQSLAPAESTGPYTRNYLVLSNIPGGLPAELSVILGSHVDWSNIQVVPTRNRPLKRRPVACPFTGLPARYRHPATLIPYANAHGYRAIEAMLRHGFVWDPDMGAYLGAEGEKTAAGVEAVQGWEHALSGGWRQGLREAKAETEPVSEEKQQPKTKRRRRG